MKCPHCGSERVKKFGKNRNGSPRSRCLDCKKTFTAGPADPKPLGPMRIPMDKAIDCLRLLLDGMSIRAVERFTRINRNTICDLILNLGERCRMFLNDRLRSVPVGDLQVDEVWSFVGCKEKTKVHCGKEDEHGVGDAYLFVGLERNTKLIVGYMLGKRTDVDTYAFADRLKDCTAGRFHLSTDGWSPYHTAMPAFFGDRIDYAQIVKTFTNAPRDKGKYCPPVIVSVGKKGICGNPDDKLTCTSHVERSNLTIRMTLRRWTRLTNAFSKSWKHHEAAVSLYIAFYDFIRPHMSLDNRTPAQESRLTDHRWSWEELLNATAV